MQDIVSLITGISASIKVNIGWIKDVGTLVFTAVGTYIAILTYRRASATILQPIRSEVIKKQSELLTHLLEYISQGIETKIGYIGLASVNTFMVLSRYGFILSNHKEIMEKVRGSIDGWTPCGDNVHLKDVEIVPMLKNTGGNENENVKDDIGKMLFEQAKLGTIIIDKIYFTKEYIEFQQKFHEYTDTPFLPKNIQQILHKIAKDINYNLIIHLKQTIERFMKDFSKTYFDEGKILQTSPIGVYNEFNHVRIHHRADLDSLKKEIREYLHIDDKW